MRPRTPGCGRRYARRRADGWPFRKSDLPDWAHTPRIAYWSQVMGEIVGLLVAAIHSLLLPRSRLQLEVLLLRHQPRQGQYAASTLSDTACAGVISATSRG